MTIFRASATIAFSALLCAAAGTTVGYCLGEFAPGAYRSMFAHGIDPRFNPVEVGIGLGCVQGLIAGVVIGIVIILAVTWYEIRMAEIRSRGTPQHLSPP